MSRPKYAIISTEQRRDLEAPLAFFQTLDVYHFYRHTPLRDMRTEDFAPQTRQYRHPFELAAQLRDLNPDIVQGVEPFALITQPYLKIICDYVASHQKPLVAVSLENIAPVIKYGPVAWLCAPIVKRYIRLARIIIAVNSGSEYLFLRYGADPHKIHRCMYGTWGVNLDEFAPHGIRASELCTNKRVILFVGRIHPMKGVFDLYAAFRQIADQINDTILVFIGTGSAEPQLQQQIHRDQLQTRVFLLGTVKNADVAAYMRSATMLVAPSVTTWQWKEQVGMVLIQAMACGLPVLATHSGSIAEFVPHGQVGFLVAEHRPDQLAQAMRVLLVNEPLRQFLGRQGHIYAMQHYDASKNIRYAEKIIQDTCL